MDYYIVLDDVRYDYRQVMPCRIYLSGTCSLASRRSVIAQYLHVLAPMNSAHPILRSWSHRSEFRFIRLSFLGTYGTSFDTAQTSALQVHYDDIPLVLLCPLLLCPTPAMP